MGQGTMKQIAPELQGYMLQTVAVNEACMHLGLFLITLLREYS